VKDIPVNMITVTVEDTEVQLPVTSFNIKIDGSAASLDSPLYENASVQIDTVDKVPKLIDIFSLLDIDLSRAKSYQLKINGDDASFMNTIYDKDKIDIVLNRGENVGSINNYSESSS
jgi:hypothetical protein